MLFVPKHRKKKVIFSMGIPYKPSPATKVIFSGVINMANFNLSFSEQVAVAISFVDAAGNPALVSNVTAVMSDPAIATVSIPAEVGPVANVAAIVSAVGPIGSSNLTVTGTNPDGSAVTGVQEFTIVAGNAVAVNFAIGAPTVIVPAV